MYHPDATLSCYSVITGLSYKSTCTLVLVIALHPSQQFFSHVNTWSTSLASLLWDIKSNSIAPDVTPQNAASHLGLFCSLREFLSKN